LRAIAAVGAIIDTERPIAGSKPCFLAITVIPCLRSGRGAAFCCTPSRLGPVK
jgi:hypothetical protein